MQRVSDALHASLSPHLRRAMHGGCDDGVACFPTYLESLGPVLSSMFGMWYIYIVYFVINTEYFVKVRALLAHTFEYVAVL
jgi:hypothetical protein